MVLRIAPRIYVTLGYVGGPGCELSMIAFAVLFVVFGVCVCIYIYMEML